MMMVLGSYLFTQSDINKMLGPAGAATRKWVRLWSICHAVF